MRKKTPEEFKKEVYDIVGDEYTILTDYELSSKHIQMQHMVCGHTYSVRPNLFLKGRRCPKCKGNNAKRKTTEMFKSEVRRLVGDEYTVMGQYVNRATKVEMRHNKCGRVYEVEPGNFLYRSRCIECYYAQLRLTTEEFEDRLLEALGKEYLLESEYKGMYEIVKIRHLACGNSYKSKPNDIIFKHSGCKTCSQSTGEGYVSSYLSEKGIKFEHQKTFPDLKNVSYLSYDFYLPDYDVVIEYQGEQHFKPKTFGGITKHEAEKRLAQQKHHDMIKEKYALDNNYTLLQPNYKLNTYSKLKEYLDNNLQCYK